MIPRILIVDDHDVVRQGTRAILQRSRPEWNICGEASTGREAMDAVKKYRPDVVILDISMPDMTGTEATPEIASMAPECRILLFTMHESKALASEAQHLGAHGYVQKTHAGRDLVPAVERLLAGDVFFDPSDEPEPGSHTSEQNKVSDKVSSERRSSQPSRQRKPFSSKLAGSAGEGKVCRAMGRFDRLIRTKGDSERWQHLIYKALSSGGVMAFELRFLKSI